MNVDMECEKRHSNKENLEVAKVDQTRDIEGV